MINYKKVERGEFDDYNFNLQIEKAIKTISTSNELPLENFKKIRHSLDQAYSVGSENFSGQYLTYEMSKDNKYVGHLDCFINNEKTYIEIFTM